MQKIKQIICNKIVFFSILLKKGKNSLQTKSLGPSVIYTFIHFYSYHNGLCSYPKSNTIFKTFSN